MRSSVCPIGGGNCIGSERASRCKLSVSLPLYVWGQRKQGMQKPTLGYQLSQIARVKPTHSLTSVHFTPFPLCILTFSLYLSLTISLPFCRLTTRRSPSWSPSILRIPNSFHHGYPCLSLLGHLLGWTDRAASFPGTSFLLTSDCFCPRPAAPWPNRFAVSLNFLDYPNLRRRRHRLPLDDGV